MAILTTKLVWRRREFTTKRSELAPTRAQQANVRRSIAHLKARLGSVKAMARAMGTTHDGLRKACSAQRPPTLRLAIAVAYAAGVDVEHVLAGQPLPGPCPFCGRA